MNYYLLYVQDRIGSLVYAANYIHQSPHSLEHVIDAVLQNWFGEGDTLYDGESRIAESLATVGPVRCAEVLGSQTLTKEHFDFLAEHGYVVEL